MADVFDPIDIVKTPREHHFLRTAVAAFFGLIALFLILASITLVWLDRTLTNTDTYVNTVAPIALQPEVQDYIADKVTDGLLDNAQTNELATALLEPSELSGKTVDQLKATLRPILRQNVLQILRSTHFTKLWHDTNESAHKQLVSQIKSNSNQLVLDLHPVVVGVIDQLKTTKLGNLSENISKDAVKADVGKINVAGSTVDTVRKLYTLLQNATYVVVLATIAAIVLCISISTHHIKTLRRITFFAGVISLLIALLLRAPSLVRPGGPDPGAQRAGIAIANTLFHNLQVTTFAMAAVFLTLAIGTKAFSELRGNA